jgi:hypothetical protein
MVYDPTFKSGSGMATKNDSLTFGFNVAETFPVVRIFQNSILKIPGAVTG